MEGSERPGSVLFCLFVLSVRSLDWPDISCHLFSYQSEQGRHPSLCHVLGHPLHRCCTHHPETKVGIPLAIHPDFLSPFFFFFLIIANYLRGMLGTVNNSLLSQGPQCEGGADRWQTADSRRGLFSCPPRWAAPCPGHPG